MTAILESITNHGHSGFLQESDHLTQVYDLFLTVLSNLSGPPMVEGLPQQLHVVLGKEFQITCTATNDQDAPMNLMLSWRTPNSIGIITTNEHNGLRAISTLHISNVTRDHDGVYQCTASNGERRGNNVSVSSTLVIEGNSYVV